MGGGFWDEVGRTSDVAVVGRAGWDWGEEGRAVKVLVCVVMGRDC